MLSDGLFLLEIFVFQQEFGGLRNGNGVFLHGIRGFVLERPVFVLPDGVFLLPAPVACRKSPCSCSKPGRACRESQRSCSRGAIAIMGLCTSCLHHPLLPERGLRGIGACCWRVILVLNP